MFFRRLLKLTGQNNALRDFGIPLCLTSQSAETVFTDKLRQFRIILRLSEIAGHILLLARQDRLINKIHQPVKVEDVLLDRRAGKKQFKRAVRDPFQFPCLLVIVLIHRRKQTCFLKYGNVPDDLLDLLGALNGEVKGGQHNGVLFKCVAHTAELCGICNCDKGNAVFVLDQPFPLNQKIGVGDKDDTSRFALVPLLRNHEHCFRGLAKPAFVH